MMCVAVTVSC